MHIGLFLVALMLVACAQEPDGTASATGSASAADLVHVHGLAESEDGLYVATHLGLFEVNGSDIRRVGAATHDLMGFTVAGPNDLLASGHPDLRDDTLMVEGKPPLLGLVHSTDGETWEPLSLLGEVDFHSLDAVHGRVYGLDSTSGRFMVSDDRKTWETRPPFPMVDFAVSPDDPDVIVATNGGEIARDGGRAWEKVHSGQLGVLEWSSRGLYAVTADRRLSVSRDDGETWSSTGSLPGQAEALHLGKQAIYVALAEHGIVRSTDGGKTFELLVDTTH